MTKVELGRRIRDLRIARGLSQGELGGVLRPPRSHAAVSDIERGKTALDIEGISMIAAVFGLEVGGLVAGDVPSNPPDELAVQIVRRIERLERQVCAVWGRLGPWD